MIICLKGILSKAYLFIDNTKIINANLKFIIKTPTQKA